MTHSAQGHEFQPVPHYESASSKIYNRIVRGSNAKLMNLDGLRQVW